MNFIYTTVVLTVSGLCIPQQALSAPVCFEYLTDSLWVPKLIALSTRLNNLCFVNDLGFATFGLRYLGTERSLEAGVNSSVLNSPHMTDSTSQSTVSPPPNYDTSLLKYP